MIFVRQHLIRYSILCRDKVDRYKWSGHCSVMNRCHYERHDRPKEEDDVIKINIVDRVAIQTNGITLSAHPVEPRWGIFYISVQQLKHPGEKK